MNQTNPANVAAAREIVLSVRNIDVSFGSKQILHNLDLDVYRGEILGFVGASGSGKSVLMRCMDNSAAVEFKILLSLPAFEKRSNTKLRFDTF